MSLVRFRGDPARIVAVARSQIGTGEVPPNSNRTVYNQWFGMNPAPWCIIFMSWVFDRAGYRLPPLSNARGAAYTPSVVDHARRTGQWRPPSYRPLPGDLVIYRFTTRPDHGGIVAEQGRMVDGRVHTIEGNTGSDPRNGGRVLERFRASNIIGFVAIDRATPPSQRPPTAPDPTPPEVTVDTGRTRFIRLNQPGHQAHGRTEAVGDFLRRHISDPAEFAALDALGVIEQVTAAQFNTMTSGRQPVSGHGGWRA